MPISSHCIVHLHKFYKFMNCTPFGCCLPCLDFCLLSVVDCCVSVEDCCLSFVVVVHCYCKLIVVCRLSVYRLLIVGCRCRSLLLQADCRVSAVGCQLFVVGCRYRSVFLYAACRVSTVGCLMMIVGVACRSKF